MRKCCRLGNMAGVRAVGGVWLMSARSSPMLTKVVRGAVTDQWSPLRRSAVSIAWGFPKVCGRCLAVAEPCECVLSSA